MASYHHHHHLYHQQPNPLPASGTTCCCSCSSTQCHHSPPPPPPPLQPPSSVDPLLQSIASHLLNQQQSHNQTHLQTPYLDDEQTHRTRKQKGQIHRYKQQHISLKREEHLLDSQFVLDSLFSRIDALESSLHHFSTSDMHQRKYHSKFSSLKEVAARVIQTHFRAFLVRRSRTLRQLKDLAVIKSRFNALKSSLSSKTRFDFEAVSQNTMDLLLKLDSIQGGDPMIRDGKRSISKDMFRFLDSIDEVYIRRHEISYAANKNVRVFRKSDKSRVLGSNPRNVIGDQSEIIRDLTQRVEKISRLSGKRDDKDVELERFHQVIEDDDDDEEENPRISMNRTDAMSKLRNRVSVMNGQTGKSRVKKSVSFADDENMYRVYSNSIVPTSIEESKSSDGSSSSEDHGEDLTDSHGNEVEEIKGLIEEDEDEEAHSEENIEGSQQSSDEQRSPRENSNAHIKSETHGEFTVRNGNLLFSAPLPVKMETRADLMKKLKAAKSFH